MRIEDETYEPSGRVDSGITRSSVRGSIAIPATVLSGSMGGKVMTEGERESLRSLKLSHALRRPHHWPRRRRQVNLRYVLHRAPARLAENSTSRKSRSCSPLRG